MVLSGVFTLCTVFAMARLGRFDVRQVRRAIDSNRPELLALACSAVGIDRSVFPTILEHVRQDKATLIKEAESQGFKLIEDKRFMKQNYALRFAKQ